MYPRVSGTEPGDRLCADGGFRDVPKALELLLHLHLGIVTWTQHGDRTHVWAGWIKGHCGVGAGAGRAALVPWLPVKSPGGQCLTASLCMQPVEILSPAREA